MVGGLFLILEFMAFELVCGWLLEDEARQKGALRIAGVDEVGRGPLFGPVVAAAVILHKGCSIPGLNDSKKLNERRRIELEPEIKANAVSWAIGEVDAETIDRINIRQASLLAMRLAVEQLALSPDFLLIDGRDTIHWSGSQRAVIKGDAQSFSIAAASVLAKLYRDRMIVELDAVYPGYGLARHKGYGCPEHLAAIARLGPTPLHRRSFNGVGQSVFCFDKPLFDDLLRPAGSSGQTAPADGTDLEEDEACEFLNAADSTPGANLAGSERQPAAAPDAILDATPEAVNAPAEPPQQRHTCPCCGYRTLADEPPGTYAICEVCQWEDDQAQHDDPAFEGGANALSLHQARVCFQQCGASDPQFASNCRKPRLDEMPQGLHSIL